VPHPAGERFDELLALTAEVGDPVRDYVILAEGNTSTRIDAGSMWVKASGVRMERADGPDAFVAVELEPLMRALRGDDDPGDDLTAVLARARVPGQPEDRAPSVETFVHAICLELGGAEFVAHTHPTAVNRLLCSRDAEAAYAGVLFPDEALVCGPVPLFVPFDEPGLPVARLVLDRFRAFLDEHGAPPRLILLANHGIVALGSSPAEVAAITAMAVKGASIRSGTLAAGGPAFLADDQAARLFLREDEQARRKALSTAHADGS
jgi:rhamnose utilization protein RhaD (predicted bifunctional aldolase and dehydrogenase)